MRDKSGVLIPNGPLDLLSAAVPRSASGSSPDVCPASAGPCSSGLVAAGAGLSAEAGDRKDSTPSPDRFLTFHKYAFFFFFSFKI